MPAAVEMAVAQKAITTLFQVPSAICGSWNMARYHSSEKCPQTANREELKLNTASVSSGRCRNA